MSTPPLCPSGAKIDLVPDETADVVALWRLQSAYADIVTRRAWTELDTVFLPDVTIEVDTVTTEPHRFVGPAEFTNFVGPSVARFDHFEFVILNTVVDVAGDAARGRIFMCEVRHESASDEWSTAYGLYQDTYRRVDASWWIAHRRYRSLARTGANHGIFGIPEDLDRFTR
jgi:hypothetical protein